MKILLLANYANDRQESMGRFAGLMQDGLAQAGHEVRLLRPPVLMGRLKDGNSGLGKWLGYVDKFVLFPGRLRGEARQADVVHICDHSNAMYSKWSGAIPCVVTCHDMLAVRGAMGEQTDCPASFAGRRLQQWIVRGLRRASAVVPVSTATAEDFQRIVGGRKPRIILNSLNYPYRPLAREEALARLSQEQWDWTRPFVLHVGSNLARKNRPVVIRAFAQASREADLQLIFAGPPLTPELWQLIRSEGIAERVKAMVKPTSEVLEALYSLALAFFFPSRYEGFGWPLIEAQACGCPVICSHCAPFAEVVGASAICREHDDVSGFAQDILRLGRDDGERRAWIEAGLRNAGRFQPAQMIAQYVDLYRGLAENAAPGKPVARLG
jgi:glycosyltransferase involved in cell wall biosynthesis